MQSQPSFAASSSSSPPSLAREVAAALPLLLSPDARASGEAIERLWQRAEAALAQLNAQRAPEARYLVESGQRALNARAQALGELLLAQAGVAAEGEEEEGEGPSSADAKARAVGSAGPPRSGGAGADAGAGDGDGDGDAVETMR